MANKQLNAVITIGGTVTGALKSALGSTRTKLQQIGGAIRNLEREQRRLQAGIRDGMNMGRPVGHLVEQYRKLEAQIGKTRRQQDRMNNAMRGMEKGKAMMANAGMAIGAVTAAASTAFIPVIQAASFEKAMLGVAKQVDGARDKNGQLTKTYYDMAKAIQLLGREIPIPTNELAKMAEQGARMGVPKENLIEFTRTAAKLATALDLPREELADNMGKIAALFKVPIPEIEKLGDAINFLDDNAISKGGDIIEFLRRTGGVAGVVKVTANEMAALGSTLLSLGEPTETAGTAVNAFFQKLAAADKGTKKFRRALDEIGISAEQVQKGMQTDAQGTILKVIDAVNKLPQEQRLGVLVDLVGLEHSDTLAKLVGNVSEYRKQIDLVNSQKVAGSVSREFAAQLATTSAQWEITKNRLVEVGVNIGSVLLPPLNKLLGGVGKVTSAVADWARENPALVKTIFTVAGALAGSIGVIKAVGMAVGAVKFAFFALKLACMTNPLGLAFVILTTAAALIYTHWEPIKGFFSRLWENVKATAEKAWTWIKTALQFSPLGPVIRNWQPLLTFFTGLFNDIMSVARKAMDWVMNKIAAVGNAWTKTKQFFGFGGDAPAAPAPAPSGRRPPAMPPMATGRGGAGTYTDSRQQTFNITQQPGQDPRALARAITAQQDANARFKRGSILHDAPRGA